MKIFELAKQKNVTSKEIIEFLKSKGFVVKSHSVVLTSEMEKALTELFSNKPVVKTDAVEEVSVEETIVKKEMPEREIKKFGLDDMIACRSIVPWLLVRVGVDRNTVYTWNNYGDVEYVRYRDLQALRKTDLITAPKVVIEDPDLCYLWRKDLGDTYKYFIDVEYPEEFFDLPDEQFKNLMTSAPKVIKEVIKNTAMDMIRNTNYPTLQKLTLIDEILGTCIKEFL